MSHHPNLRRNESEYFARREADLLRQQREALRDERLAAERRTHFMKCPVCGYDLMHSEWEGFHLDQCPHCQGIWITAEQARRLVHHTDTPLSWVFESVLQGLVGIRTGTS